MPFWTAALIAVALWLWCMHRAIRAKDRFLDVLSARRPDLDVPRQRGLGLPLRRRSFAGQIYASGQGLRAQGMLLTNFHDRELDGLRGRFWDWVWMSVGLPVVAMVVVWAVALIISVIDGH